VPRPLQMEAQKSARRSRLCRRGPSLSPQGAPDNGRVSQGWNTHRGMPRRSRGGRAQIGPVDGHFRRLSHGWECKRPCHTHGTGEGAAPGASTALGTSGLLDRLLTQGQHACRGVVYEAGWWVPPGALPCASQDVRDNRSVQVIARFAKRTQSKQRDLANTAASHAAASGITA
jgi:hypothetical protein